MTTNKKGQLSLGNAPAAILALVILGIFLVVGAFVIQGVQDNTTTGTPERVISVQSLAALLTFGNFQNVIAIIVAAVIILSLIAFFRFRG